MSRLRRKLSENLVNIRGWRTKRKIVVFESDDWGSIRMPSKGVFDTLLKANIRVDKCPFCSFDSLASEDDLTSLFEVLESFSDLNGNHPVITANTVVANPDFSKILDSGFKEYHYELFTDTLKKYPNHNDSFSLWKEGIDKGIFYPQLHGREHLNVNRWMKALRAGSREMLISFYHNMFGISSDISNEGSKSYLASFDADYEHELSLHEIIVQESVSSFKLLFGFSPETFVAPNYIWTNRIEETLLKEGIKIIQGSKVQLVPNFKAGYEVKRHYTGQKNIIGQIYTLRNCIFEPSLKPNSDWQSACLRQIGTSFSWNKPAIIGTHRLNYIGSIVENNRRDNLILLSKLLAQILKNWPDVEFLNSQQLGRQIIN